MPASATRNQTVGGHKVSRRRLEVDGFEVVENVLDDGMLRRLRSYSDRRLAAESSEHFGQFRFHGSMLPLDPFQDEVVADLVTSSSTMSALRDLGFDDPRWLSAYLISKPPQSPSLWWHQDWWAWDEPVSYATFPPQLFVMFYLSDTDEKNGALRVIPGSHRAEHALRFQLPEAHGQEIGDAQVESIAHRRQPDEITVPVAAGSAVFGDVRLLHATHPNRSASSRTCLTLWYLPAWSSLPESIQSYVVDHPALPERGWWRDASGPPLDRRVARILPTYDGNAKPATYRRRPRRRHAEGA